LFILRHHFLRGAAAFEIRGADAAEDVPAKLEPTEHSPRVGFRCAFSFED